jgi:hypothetical protein
MKAALQGWPLHCYLLHRAHERHAHAKQVWIHIEEH